MKLHILQGFKVHYNTAEEGIQSEDYGVSTIFFVQYCRYISSVETKK